MNFEDVKTPEDVLEFMKSNIRYGWIDNDGFEHIKTMKEFRKKYRTSSLEEILSHGLGTCIEQVYLMHILLDNIGVDNKMFCTRVYEDRDYNDLEAEEHMHCFVLFYKNGKAYHIEHPNWERVGIYEYENEEVALKEVNDYFVEMADGQSRPVCEFFDVQPGLSFKDFNNYVNSLSDIKIK